MDYPETLWDITRLAAFLGYSRNHVYALCRRGEIPHFRVLGIIRFDPAAVHAWLDANQRGPAMAVAQ